MLRNVTILLVCQGIIYIRNGHVFTDEIGLRVRDLTLKKNSSNLTSGRGIGNFYLKVYVLLL